MATSADKRLADLEAAIKARPARWVTVFEQAGVYWRCESPDPRTALNPDAPGAHRLTAGDVAQLERTHNVILVRWGNGEVNHGEDN